MNLTTLAEHVQKDRERERTNPLSPNQRGGEKERKREKEREGHCPRVPIGGKRERSRKKTFRLPSWSSSSLCDHFFLAFSAPVDHNLRMKPPPRSLLLLLFFSFFLSLSFQIKWRKKGQQQLKQVKSADNSGQTEVMSVQSVTIAM